MDKIIEISLSKIEHTKTRVNAGKTSLLHRHLLVNSLLNRVRSNDKIVPNGALMNYREPKGLIEMDIEDCDLEKVPSLSKKNIRKQRTTTLLKKTSLLITTNTENKHDTVLKEKHENVICECSKSRDSKAKKEHSTKKQRKRHAVESGDQTCIKKLRGSFTKPQEIGTSVTNLASLFNDLVANTETESSSLTFQGNFLTATMVAC